MTKFIFLFLTIMPFIVFGQKAKIEFEETSHNFGTIGENNGKATHEFRFKNTGEAPLILTNVRAGCGCTTPEWNRQPVAPGAEGFIKVSFDPRNRPGSFVKSITVNSNAENAVMSLTIRGNVSRKAKGPYDDYRFNAGALKISSNSVNLGGILNIPQPERTLAMINSGNEPLTVSVISNSPAITVSARPETLQKGEKGEIHILYDASKRGDWGFVTDPVTIKVNDVTSTITVTASISEDFSHYNNNFENAPIATFSETEAYLKDLPKNSTQTHEFYIQNNGKEELVIRKIKCSDDAISAIVAKNTIKPGKKVKATVTFKTGENAKVLKMVQFTVNDPKNPLIGYKISGNVK